MARGHQKIQSQQKNAERKAKAKNKTDHKAAAKKALVHMCPVCRVSKCCTLVLEMMLSL